jgi:hypothetical protein
MFSACFFHDVDATSQGTCLREETNHVFFFNYYLFASPGGYHYRYTKQHAVRVQVFRLEIADIYYSLDFLFLSHRRCNRGGSGLTQAGKKVP